MDSWVVSQISFWYTVNEVGSWYKQNKCTPYRSIGKTLLQQPNESILSHIYSFQVKPAKIVDKIIELFLDIVTPGRGAGETSWYVNFLERSSFWFLFTMTFLLESWQPTSISRCLLRLMKGWRTLEQSAERTSRELDIRADLRRWDDSYPEIHHELIVRWLAGATVSWAVTSMYNSLVRPKPRSRRYWKKMQCLKSEKG